MMQNMEVYVHCFNCTTSNVFFSTQVWHENNVIFNTNQKYLFIWGYRPCIRHGPLTLSMSPSHSHVSPVIVPPPWCRMTGQSLSVMRARAAVAAAFLRHLPPRLTAHPAESMPPPWKLSKATKQAKKRDNITWPTYAQKCPSLCG